MIIPPLVIAVDGGGSNCRCVLAKVGKDSQCWHAHTGAANVFSDFDLAIENILQGIQNLADQAGLSLNTMRSVPIYLGLAGAINQQIINRVIDSLKFTRIKVEDDRPAALNGALADQDGAIVHCGTGSFLAIRIDGSSRFVGGWGAKIGDENSAYQIGIELLSKVLWQEDGLIKATPLSEEVMNHFDRQPYKIVDFVRHADSAKIADFARLVIQYSQQDDPLANYIVHKAVKSICDILARIGWNKDLPLCITGGLGVHYKPFLSKELSISLVKPKGQPIDGALALAKEFWHQKTSQ